MKLTNEQIEKAVVWWADRVAKPTFRALNDEERKSPGNDGMKFAELLATMNVLPVTQEQRVKFMDALRAQLEIESMFGVLDYLSVDYGPCTVLSNAAKIAEISENNFPWKTNMWFNDDGTVTVSLGYQGEQVKL
jgi:hypothetical protein